MTRFLHNRKRTLAFAFIAMILVTRCSTTLNAQCNTPTLKFHSPVLITGVNGEVGAVYLFGEVIPGVDAHIEIAGIFGGATLYNIDDSTGIGYYDAFQPYVGAAANDTSYIDWKITFKIGGTNTDTMLPCLAVTGVDVDGDGMSLQEFIEAATPGSIAVDANTILNVSFDGVRSKAISTIANLPLIDSGRHEAMFQMNFVNISTLLYRNGAVSTWHAEQIRQTCIYFAPFFESTTYVVLPVKVSGFTAVPSNGNIAVEWAATNERDLFKYIVEKSIDGTNWKDVQTVKPASAANQNRYHVIDFEKRAGGSFYRLQQVNVRGQVEYSRTVYVNGSQLGKSTISHNTIFTSTLELQINAVNGENYVVNYLDAMGSSVKRDQFTLNAGNNRKTLSFPSSVSAGVYLLVISNQKGERIHTARVIKS